MLSDDAARLRARTDHTTSLVLEAGAGTGKTTLLVDRIESMIREGTATLDKIAAVTFTENAATTMKLRLRERLERARVEGKLLPEEKERVEVALESLERAQISTIHALCAAILQEWALECGVTPGFRVADEAEADLVFSDSWSEWLSGELSGGETPLLEALERDIPIEPVLGSDRGTLRGLAKAIVEQRDLEAIAETSGLDPLALRDELTRRAEAARAFLQQVQPGDLLRHRLDLFVSFAEEAERLTGTALVDHLLSLRPIPRNIGFKKWWSSNETLQEARALAHWTGEAAAAWNAEAQAALHGKIVKALRGVTLIYERRKTEQGLLDFLDLLVKTRDALKERAPLREKVRRRFPYVMIDEFQDTDPLQVEIARLLSEDRPGGLVVVGDPKQSIYRFRRAEVSLFSRLSQEAEKRPGWAVLHLTQNFRSRPGILRFVNRIFTSRIRASTESGQPPYEPLEPPPGLSDEPSVVALSFSAPFDAPGDILRGEAAALASFLIGAARGERVVRDLGTGTERASRAGDAMVLVRRLTHVRYLEDALEKASLRFTVEGGKSFFDRLEVREALAVLRAIEDPSDRISLVGALRSSFLGVSDRDIATYVLAGGRLWLGEPDESKPSAASLAPAMRLLASLHDLRTRVSVPFLLETLYDETRVLPGLSGSPKGDAQIANLEKIVALSRQASDLGIRTLRGFVRFLQERMESAREEPDLPVSRPGDPDTVRILSIHKAKGLEAPIVALFDSADPGIPFIDSVSFWEEGRVALGFRKYCQPKGWDALVTREKLKQLAELERLLYVATTRARDLLAVPRPLGGRGGFLSPLTAPPLSDVVLEEPGAFSETREDAPDLKPLSVASGGDPEAERWEKERALRIEQAAFVPFSPARAGDVAARTAPPSVLAPGRRDGRSFGTLVHRVLELIDLGRPDEASSLAVALAPSCGQDEAAAASAAALVERTLGLDVLERARKARFCQREFPVVFPDGADLIEGVVDLVFEEPEGLVVVDYKTDAIAEEQAFPQAAHHAPQLQLYGRGLALASGLKIKERLVVFVSISKAVPV